MSTSKSPKFRHRLKKLDGGRAKINIQLPQEEVMEIDKYAEQRGVSRSSIIAQRYFLGKEAELSN